MNTLIETTQQAVHTVVNEVMQANPQNEKEQQYQSVLSMVYTLVEDGKLSELHQTIKTAFPEYYH